MVEIENTLFRLAVKSGDIFRQWLYTDIPHNYEVSHRAKQWMEAEARRGTPLADIPRLALAEANYWNAYERE